jgi:hypothetical protein
MSDFELLSLDLLREIFSWTSTLNDIASIRRTCKKFYLAIRLYDKDLFVIRYNNEMSKFGLKSDNMMYYLSQGFYYNFFPAVRHALRNGIRLDHKFIRIEHDALGRLYNSQYIDNRLSLWKQILKYYKIEDEHVNYIVYYASKKISKSRNDSKSLICNYYLSLMALIVERNVIR